MILCELKLIKKHNYKLRTFSTNGSGLFDLYEDKYIIEHDGLVMFECKKTYL